MGMSGDILLPLEGGRDPPLQFFVGGNGMEIPGQLGLLDDRTVSRHAVPGDCPGESFRDCPASPVQPGVAARQPEVAGKNRPEGRYPRRVHGAVSRRGIFKPVPLIEVATTGKIFRYPCGVVDVLASDQAVFRRTGWEEVGKEVPRRRKKQDNATDDESETGDESVTGAVTAAMREEMERKARDNFLRSVRRARAKVRRLALANEFKWFVTLTLDKERIDRYDAKEIIARLQRWLQDRVKRSGLQYILIPERHKDGAWHFHGFFNGALDMVESGHTDKLGHTIYNCPAWGFGFSACIELYGDYPAAVAYVVKYIGKQGDKAAGRWYYSGGGLREPEVDYVMLDWREVAAMSRKSVQFSVAGKLFVVCNGLPVNPG